ncbi:pyridoxamine 5'-phosphate oxidase family protein [Solicola sp. PLA-1-18]|uniref:pyridoxamine 5'-phosphate oxidase family protein n=1 Tax=Solicola sp. PLA-1-18 TaxID=3380532 RepID=UPI003B793B9A
MPQTREITTVDELRDVVGHPNERAAGKVRDRLDDLHRAWLARSPFHLVATTGADGSMDVSPKGDPAGAVHVIDDRTIALPDRPGNRRVDGFENILQNPRVGLIFLVPRRGDTLRVNGRARLLVDAPYAEAMEVKGHRPTIVTEVAVDEVFFHCSKAFLRSDLWDPEAWPADDLPTQAQIAKAASPDTPMAELQQHYDPEHYRSLMY